MLNKRGMKALSEILEYLDGEEVEAMKGADLLGGDGEGEKGVTVVKVEKEEPGEDMEDGEESDTCPECGSKTLGGTFCPGCGKRLKGGEHGGGY